MELPAFRPCFDSVWIQTAYKIFHHTVTRPAIVPSAGKIARSWTMGDTETGIFGNIAGFRTGSTWRRVIDSQVETGVIKPGFVDCSAHIAVSAVKRQHEIIILHTVLNDA